MIRYADFNGECFIIGTAEQIKPVFKSMYRAWMMDRTRLTPVYIENRVSHFHFVPGRVYGIGIDPEEKTFSIWTAEQIIHLWIHEEKEEM